jgi:hypothetical protein
VQLLVSEGADKEITNSDGATPLFVACSKGHMEVVQLLVSEGADKEITNSVGATPLFVACSNGHMEVVQLLLSEGADTETTDRGGDTPLLIACQEGHVEVVRLLVSEGADKETTNSDDVAPLYIACQGGRGSSLRGRRRSPHSEVVKVLLAAFSREHRSSSIAAKRVWVERTIQDMKGAEAQRTNAESIPLVIAVPQSGLLQGLCHAFSAYDFSSGIDVQFEGSSAVGDGVRREYLNLMAEEFSNLDHALLETRASDGSHAHRMQPSESSGRVNPDHLAYFEMLGKLIGVALMQAGGCLCIRFTIPFLKQLLGQPIDIPDDLERVDPALYATKVVQLRQYDEATLSACDLTFEEEEHQFHFAPGVRPAAVSVSSTVAPTTVVTTANREEYIQAFCRHHLICKIAQQTAAVRQGLLSVVPAVLLEALQECLSVREFGILIAGFDDLNLGDWQQHTQYEDGYTADSLQIKWFWSILNESESDGDSSGGGISSSGASGSSSGDGSSSGSSGSSGGGSSSSSSGGGSSSGSSNGGGSSSSSSGGGSSSGSSGGGSSSGSSGSSSRAVPTLAKLTLRFATGSESVGAGGFELLRGYNGAMHKFTIKRSGDPESLPRAATCFNTLYLPAYSTREALEAKLHIAVREGKGGFDEGAVAQ